MAKMPTMRQISSRVHVCNPKCATPRSQSASLSSSRIRSGSTLQPAAVKGKLQRSGTASGLDNNLYAFWRNSCAFKVHFRIQSVLPRCRLGAVKLMFCFSISCSSSCSGSNAGRWLPARLIYTALLKNRLTKGRTSGQVAAKMRFHETSSAYSCTGLSSNFAVRYCRCLNFRLLWDRLHTNADSDPAFCFICMYSGLRRSSMWAISVRDCSVLVKDGKLVFAFDK